MQQLLHNLGIPTGPNQEVLNIAYSMAKDAEEKQNHDIARMGYGILYELLGADEFKEKLEALASVK